MTVCKKLLYENNQQTHRYFTGSFGLNHSNFHFIPTGFEGAVQFKDADKCRVKIESVDNSR